MVCIAKENAEHYHPFSSEDYASERLRRFQQSLSYTSFAAAARRGQEYEAGNVETLHTRDWLEESDSDEERIQRRRERVPSRTSETAAINRGSPERSVSPTISTMPEPTIAGGAARADYLPSRVDDDTLRRRQDRNDRISARLAHYLPQGWAMLAETCNTCGTVLLRQRGSSETYCVACKEIDVEDQQQAQQQAQQQVISTPAQPAQRRQQQPPSVEPSASAAIAAGENAPSIDPVSSAALDRLTQRFQDLARDIHGPQGASGASGLQATSSAAPSDHTDRYSFGTVRNITNTGATINSARLGTVPMDREELYKRAVEQHGSQGSAPHQQSSPGSATHLPSSSQGTGLPAAFSAGGSDPAVQASSSSHHNALHHSHHHHHKRPRSSHDLRGGAVTSTMFTPGVAVHHNPTGYRSFPRGHGYPDGPSPDFGQGGGPDVPDSVHGSLLDALEHVSQKLRTTSEQLAESSTYSECTRLTQLIKELGEAMLALQQARRAL
eukprot:Clim_evm8s21 gene=Clim_evmTU8s21